VRLTTVIWNHQVFKSSHVFYKTQTFRNLIHVKSWYIFKTNLITYLYPRASELFLCGPRTKIFWCISVQSNMSHTHRSSHLPIYSTVQLMKLLITMLLSLIAPIKATHISLQENVNWCKIYLWFIFDYLSYIMLCACVIHWISSLMKKH